MVVPPGMKYILVMLPYNEIDCQRLLCILPCVHSKTVPSTTFSDVPHACSLDMVKANVLVEEGVKSSLDCCACAVFHQAGVSGRGGVEVEIHVIVHHLHFMPEMPVWKDQVGH